MVKVHVGIVTYNSLQDVPYCISALRRQTFSPIHIVALDNASIDGSVEWLRSEAPDIDLIVCDQNLGFAAAHNRIIVYCELQADEYYLPLNPDVMLEPAYIESLVQTLDRRNAGWVTGKLLLSGETDAGALPHKIYSVGHGLRRDGYAINVGYGLLDEGQFEVEREVFGAPGAAPLFCQRMIAEISSDHAFFDEDMFMYVEDTDLDWRARLRGWRCWYTPAAVAFHRGSTPSWKMEALTVANRYLSVIKNAYLPDLFVYNLPIIIAHCLLRLVLTPAFGYQLTTRLFRLVIKFWHKRGEPAVPRAEMLEWFAWSVRQPTTQPGPFTKRLKYALSRAPGAGNQL